MAAPDTYLVTRLPGAPPRRAGRVWAVGACEATLSPAEVAAIAADPGYLIVAAAGGDRTDGTDGTYAPAIGPMSPIGPIAETPPSPKPRRRAKP